MIMIQIGRRNTKSTTAKAMIAGAVIGAAGTAIGIAMSDKNNREKVKKSLGNAKQWTEEKMSTGQNNPKEPAERVKDEAKKARAKIESPEQRVR